MRDHWLPGHDGRPRPTPPALEAMTPSQRDRVATPDGVALSGWWRRLLAYWVDGILVALAAQVLILPLQLVQPGVTLGASPPSVALEAWTTPYSPSWWFGIATVVAMLAVGAAYSILMLSRLGWTLGKRLLGIRVRHRDHERRPTVAEATARWAVQLAPVALTPVPWLGGAANVWTTIDGLRPLWDARRQAFHDSAAATSVVRA